MSTGEIWQTTSTSLEDTLSLAETVGRKLKGGEVIELTSDLGGGKTAFVQGLVRGAGSQDKVHSPSFTLSNQYRAGHLTIHHFDLYRLNEPGLISNELKEVLLDSNAVTVVEWGKIVDGVLPVDRITIAIQATGEASRDLSLKYPAKLKYLIPD